VAGASYRIFGPDLMLPPSAAFIRNSPGNLTQVSPLDDPALPVGKLTSIYHKLTAEAAYTSVLTALSSSGRLFPG